ncbi:ATP-binding protein, partial [Patescibacteria group bacterium]
IFELFPLNFEEFLIFKEENVKKYRTLKKKKIINEMEYEIYDKYYEEFIEWGGFPEVVLTERIESKKDLLEDIFSSYYQNEILKLADYRKNKKMRDLILLLAARVGSQLDIVKLSQELQLNRITVYSYLSFLQATYFIHLVSPFSKSIDREVSGTKKVYFCDTGILKTIATVNDGQVFKNAVYNQLKDKAEINYFRKKSGAEIDFIANKKIAYEVKQTATKSSVNKLKRIAEGMKLKEEFVVSKKYVKNLDNMVFGQFL